MPTTTVYLIEDDEGSRDSTVCLLGLHGIQSKCFETAEDFLVSELESRVGCIVTDLVLPGMNGIEMYQKALEQGWNLPAVIITAHGDVSSVTNAFRNGVTEYFEKPVHPERLVQSVKNCIEASKKAYEFEVRKAVEIQRLRTLTPKERQVLLFLFEGKTIAEIASEFGVSFQAVARHRIGILTKLKVEGDVLLLRRILEHDLESELCRTT